MPSRNPALHSAAHIIVKGRVQGVGYRFYVQARAEARDLKGWVRNLSDGAVECEVEGPRPAIDELVKELEKGPPLSCVENVQVSWKPSADQFSEFTITF